MGVYLQKQTLFNVYSTEDVRISSISLLAAHGEFVYFSQSVPSQYNQYFEISLYMVKRNGQYVSKINVTGNMLQ